MLLWLQAASHTAAPEWGGQLPQAPTWAGMVSQQWQLRKSQSVEQRGLSSSLPSDKLTSQQQAEPCGSVENHCAGEVQGEEAPRSQLC